MTTQVSASTIIDLSVADAWQRLRDITLAHHYVPGLIKTEVVSATTEGVGASRYVYRNERSYIQETVTEWDEGYGFTLRLHKGDKAAPPFRNARFRYQLDAAGEKATKFIATLEYELAGGFLGRWMEKAMAGFVQKTIEDVALSMKLYYETGRPTTPEALRAAKKQS